jgi:hypothetical protein
MATTNIWFGIGAPAPRFVISGGESRRADDLWRTTCFELFIQAEGESGYREWNFAPNGSWAAYDFSGYRELACDPEVAEPYIRMEDNLTWWTLGATISVEAGIFVLHQIVDQQLSWISAEESDASVDSELALVQWPAFPRYRWVMNPLHYTRPAAPHPAIMTARVDAPTPQLARRLIDDAIEVEKSGLTGVAVFDSRGLPAKKGNVPEAVIATAELRLLELQGIRDGKSWPNDEPLPETNGDRPKVVMSRGPWSHRRLGRIL